MNEWQIRCSSCGQFMRPDARGASTLFVPDTPFTYEEMVWQCRRCTDAYGPPVSRQQVRHEICTHVVGA